MLNLRPLAHKLREAMGSDVHNPDEPELSGTVEIDGAYFGGHVKPENRKEARGDRRLAEEQTGKRQVVVVAREIMGRTVHRAPRERGGSADPQAHRVRHDHPCRRIKRLGAAARVLRHPPGQSQSGIRD
jgi:ISXO2-like transposase domain